MGFSFWHLNLMGSLYKSDSKNHACPLLLRNAKALDSSQVKELDVSVVDLAFASWISLS